MELYTFFIVKINTIGKVLPPTNSYSIYVDDGVSLLDLEICPSAKVRYSLG